jgi:hypothetical protein
MSTPFDTLEDQLNTLRPARLPATARRSILQEMRRPVTGHGRAFWQFGHRTGFQAALAGALSLTLLVGGHWLSESLHSESHANPATLAASSGLVPSLALWETRLAAACPMGENTVAVLRSPSTLTNIQIRR